MQVLTDRVVEHGLRDKVLSEHQLDRLIGSSPASRYGLVNRALKAHELIRIRRGLYVLPSKYRTEPPHPFAVAQAWSPEAISPSKLRSVRTVGFQNRSA